MLLSTHTHYLVSVRSIQAKNHNWLPTKITVHINEETKQVTFMRTHTMSRKSTELPNPLTESVPLDLSKTVLRIRNSVWLGISHTQDRQALRPYRHTPPPVRTKKRTLAFTDEQLEAELIDDIEDDEEEELHDVDAEDWDGNLQNISQLLTLLQSNIEHLQQYSSTEKMENLPWALRHKESIQSVLTDTICKTRVMYNYITKTQTQLHVATGGDVQTLHIPPLQKE